MFVGWIFDKSWAEEFKECTVCWDRKKWFGVEDGEAIYSREIMKNWMSLLTQLFGWIWWNDFSSSHFYFQKLSIKLSAPFKFIHSMEFQQSLFLRCRRIYSYSSNETVFYFISYFSCVKFNFPTNNWHVKFSFHYLQNWKKKLLTC